LCEQLDEGRSLSGKLHYELRSTLTRDGEKAIWLWSKEDKSDARHLCETEGWGNLEIHFSPDDNWIVVQDGGASLGVRCRLFRLVQGLQFREIEKPDLNAEAEKLALKKIGLPAQEMTDHRYVRCIAWSGDSKMILITANGNGRVGKLAVGFEWVGVYHVQGGNFSFDLSEFNRSAVGKKPLD
jgi:WD40 repeat protein